MKAFEMLLLPLTLTVSLTTGRVARAAPQQPGRHVASLGVYEPPADQDVAAAHLRAGIELANREKLSEAAEQFVEALQVNPEFAEAHYNLGLIRLKWGDLDGAVRSFREALRINPLYTLAQLRLANALTQLARDDQRYVDEAIAAYRRVLTLDPKQPEAHFNSGFLAAKRLDFRAAAAEYEKTLSLDPKYPGARLNLGISVYKLGDFQRAYSLCRTAVAEEPGSAEAHQYLGLALSKHSEWEAAVQELRTAVRLGPENQEVHYALAQALRKAGRSDEGAAEFKLVQQMQEAWHKNVQAGFREYQVKKMIEAGEVDRAIDNYRQLLQLRKDARTATNLASALLWKGDADGAIQVLQEALRIDPSYAWAHYYLGVSLARKREYEKAREALKEALKLRPDFPEAEFYLGVTHASEGQFQEAAAYLRSAVRSRPDAAPARYYLGLVLEGLGRQKEGKAELEASRRLDPNFSLRQSTSLQGVGGNLPASTLPAGVALR